MLDRRQFFATGIVTLIPATPNAADPTVFKKAVKLGMVAGDASLTDKLALLKKLGFEGVEIDSPDAVNIEELKAASEKTGVVVHGTIVNTHWNKPLSDPDPNVRAITRQSLEKALREAQILNATTALIVPGVVNKSVSYEECWERSTEEIRKVIPVAEETKVKIAVEVVWNNFLTKPEQLVKYVDQFNTPLVGAYFDASNMLKYGVPAATWIRTLGPRMLKLDFKGYSITKAKTTGDEWKGFAVGIGEGDEDWPEVLKACQEVGYNSWFTAEVKAGNEAWLADVSKRMDKILGR